MTVTTTTARRRQRQHAGRPSDLVTLTIDGIEVSVPKGTLVIRAAEQLGIEIPRFCDHPLLDPVGACRQCLVEVEIARRRPDGCPPGMPKPLASCTTRSPTAWSSRPSSPRRSPTRRSRA